MYPPDNLDALLAELRATKHDGQVTCEALTDDDLAFVQRALDGLKTGSRGVLAMITPDDRLQYITLNAKELSAIAILGRIVTRIAERINEED
jgi:hypothetical protein